MHYSDNKTLQQAFNAGVAFAIGRNRVLMAYDSPEWITVHPNGAEHKGRPALIDNATGEVLGGMGGKFTGRHISAVKQGGKFEQMGAQMNVNRVNHKPEMMNGQNIGFRQKQTNASNELLNNHQKDLQKRYDLTEEQFNSIANSDNFKKYLNENAIPSEVANLNSAFSRAFAESEISKQRQEKQAQANEERFNRIVEKEQKLKEQNRKEQEQTKQLEQEANKNKVTVSGYEFENQKDYEDTLKALPNKINELKGKAETAKKELQQLQSELQNHSDNSMTGNIHKEALGELINEKQTLVNSLENSVKSKEGILKTLAANQPATANNATLTQKDDNMSEKTAENTLNKNEQNNKVSFNGYDFANVSEAKTFLYDAEKTIRGLKEDIISNTLKLKQSNKDLTQLQNLNQFYEDYKRDNPLFEKTLTEYFKSNKAKYKGIKANELPDMRSSKYWGPRDAERTLNIVKNAHERVADNLRNKNTEIRDLKRDIEYAKERIPRLQKIMKIGNETISKLEQ